MKKIADIKKNIEEWNNNPWYFLGRLVGEFDTEEMKRKNARIYRYIFISSPLSFKDEVFNEMLDFLSEKGMKSEERMELEKMKKNWVPLEDENTKSCFLSGYVNSQNESHQQEWISFSEAAELWHLGASTLRMAVKRGVFKTNEIRKSGDTWLVTKRAMERLYGEIE